MKRMPTYYTHNYHLQSTSEYNLAFRIQISLVGRNFKCLSISLLNNTSLPQNIIQLEKITFKQITYHSSLFKHNREHRYKISKIYSTTQVSVRKTRLNPNQSAADGNHALLQVVLPSKSEKSQNSRITFGITRETPRR